MNKETITLECQNLREYLELEEDKPFIEIKNKFLEGMYIIFKRFVEEKSIDLYYENYRIDDYSYSSKDLYVDFIEGPRIHNTKSLEYIKVVNRRNYV